MTFREMIGKVRTYTSLAVTLLSLSALSYFGGPAYAEPSRPGGDRRDATEASIPSPVTNGELEKKITTPSANRPNIVVILADDVGYGEIRGFGGEDKNGDGSIDAADFDIPTPNIDRIGDEGVRFTQAYATHPTCTPSRTGLLTGRYQQRQGVEGNPGRHDFYIDPNIPTLAERLKEVGYVTCMVGKWHLGSEKEEYWPGARGFDHSLFFPGGSSNYFPQGKSRYNPTINYPPLRRNGEFVNIRQYVTDAFGQEVVDFIKANKDKPFFVYLSFNAVHTPLQAKKEDREKFPDIKDETRLVYAGMTEAMDRAVGNVLDTLGELNLEQDTLVIFTSDNGGQTGKSTSSNKPLRGRKGRLREGGIRIPYSMQWEGHVPSGQVYENAISLMDIFPTAVAAAGEEINPDWKLDGVNLLPYVAGENKGMPHDLLFWRGGCGAWFAVLQDSRWKLTKPRSERGDKSAPTLQLYDLDNDLGETEDLAAQYPEKVRKLKSAFDEWNAEMGPLRWRRKLPEEGTGMLKLMEMLNERDNNNK